MEVFDPLRSGRAQKALLFLATLFAFNLSATAADLSPHPADALFIDGALWRIHLEIPPSGLDSLRKIPREYVRATLREGPTRIGDIGVRVKGGKGSFRSVDDKPSLTINCDSYTPGQTFHGLSKFQLNNSVEDPTFLNEKIGNELFRAAQLPAPRVAHALLDLNGRQLGLYVLKEGFTPEFLGRFFERTDGNLYEADDSGGYDIDKPMKRNSGDGVTDRSDLRQLLEATQEQDLPTRWKRLHEHLAVDSFMSFMAMEILCGHRDGYCMARNNYRIYHDPTSDRLVFLPDGMDQLFGRADWPIRPRVEGLVAQAVVDIPKGREAYVDRLQTLLTNNFMVSRLTNRVVQLTKALSSQLAHNEATSFRRESAALCKRIASRIADVKRQLTTLPEPTPLQFENNVAPLREWRPVDAPADGKLDQIRERNEETSLLIVAGRQTAASWRTQVRLTRGRYRFEAIARVEGVASIGFGQNNGAFLGVIGQAVSGRQYLTETTDWTPLQVEFEITKPEADLELSCALRASAGEAHFKTDSVFLRRLSPPSQE